MYIFIVQGMSQCYTVCILMKPNDEKYRYPTRNSIYSMLGDTLLCICVYLHVLCVHSDLVYWQSKGHKCNNIVQDMGGLSWDILASRCKNTTLSNTMTKILHHESLQRVPWRYPNIFLLPKK